MSENNEPTAQDEMPADPPPEAADDTEGHSFMYEYGRTVARDRNADAERNAREARMRDQARDKRR